MKRTELQSLINECIGEVLNEGKVTKKKLAIKEIKRIIAENELSGAEVEEAFLGFGKKPEEKLADLEKELKSKNPETYKSWVDAIETLKWREKGKIQLMADSIEKFAKGYKYPEDGRYVVSGNIIKFNTSKKDTGYNPNPRG